MIHIREEAPGDIPAREALLDRAFGRGRFRKTCEKLRRGRVPADGLSFVAVRDPHPASPFQGKEKMGLGGATLPPLEKGRVGEGISCGVLVGTVRLWEIAAGSAGPALMLGPIAVAPDLRGQGLGQALMRHALAAATARGNRAVILVGDAPYYTRFGFSTQAVAGLRMPGPVEHARFLGLEFVPGALAGASGLIVPTGRPIPLRKLPRAA